MGLNLYLKNIYTKYNNFNKYFLSIPNVGILRILNNKASKYDVPFYILLGIYIIETTNRPIFYRIIEYCATIFMGFLSFILKIRVKNFTIGVCQIGLNNILCFYSYITKRYDRYLIINSFEEYKAIIKGCKISNNIEIAAMLINEFNSESKDLSRLRQIRYIGQKYNGKIEYGICLCKLVQALEKNNIKNKL